MKNPKDFIFTYLKGMSMGAADIVPGVSGGSIALITGIYEKLLDSIKSIDKHAVKLLYRFQWKAFWAHVNGSFLLTLLLGIFTSIFTIARLITYLIQNHPIAIWSFFCGLIIISAIIILRDIKTWSFWVVFALVAGAILAYFITELPPINSPDSLSFTFVAGAIAICAMILPGISGSFLLLIMGQYQRILEAVNDKNILVLGVFGMGCVLGLLTFSRLISWLLKKFHALTIAILSGFMLGSINKIWPWKSVLTYRMDSHGNQQSLLTENILPFDYLTVTGEAPQLATAGMAFAFGIILVVGIERTAFYLSKK
jgi:putative membrane protein